MKISDIQKKKIEHFFNVLDNNGNGVLQPDDFTGVGRKICELLDLKPKTKDYELTIVHSYRLFIQIMTDLGKEDEVEITVDEWNQFFESNYISELDADSAPINGYIKRTSNYIFNLFDQNKDGLISAEEFAQMFEIYHINVSYSAESFSKLDLNNDKVISREELLQAFKEYFLSSDPEAPGNWIFGKWDD